VKLISFCSLIAYSYYNKQWAEAEQMIGDLMLLEVPPDQAKPEKVCKQIICPVFKCVVHLDDKDHLKAIKEVNIYSPTANLTQRYMLTVLA